jgi:nucleotide-binding universal stress UspA family protein
MYEKILVPLDGSDLAERAIRHAREIARGTRSEILLMQAVNFPLPVVPEAVLIPDAGWLAEAKKEAARYLEGIAAPLREAGMRVRTLLDERPPADAILHVARREEADLIVMSTHGRGGISRMLMGSVAESVFRATSRTVMLVKPERPAIVTHADEGMFLHIP